MGQTDGRIALFQNAPRAGAPLIATCVQQATVAVVDHRANLSYCYVDLSVASGPLRSQLQRARLPKTCKICINAALDDSHSVRVCLFVSPSCSVL